MYELALLRYSDSHSRLLLSTTEKPINLVILLQVSRFENFNDMRGSRTLIQEGSTSNIMTTLFSVIAETGRNATILKKKSCYLNIEALEGKGFIKIISHYKKIGNNINVLQQTACLVVNPITVGSFAFLFNCTPVGETSDSMMVPT